MSSGAMKNSTKNPASGQASRIWSAVSRRTLTPGSDLDVAVEALDPGRALLVDLFPVLEHEALLEVRVILRQHAGDLAFHLHLRVRRHDQVRALHQPRLHLGRHRGL